MHIYHASISVFDLLESLKEKAQSSLVTSQDISDKNIKTAIVQKSGLYLTGAVEYMVPNSLQIFGKSEFAFLRSLETQVRKQNLEKFLHKTPTVIIVCSNQRCSAEFKKQCEQLSIPIIKTELASYELQPFLVRYLQEVFSPRATVHGSLMDVFGVGILITGMSSVGKSECALELILRGHPLVADDVVELRKYEDQIVGTSPQIVRNHLEIRGLGIVNVRDLFGVVSVREKKNIQLVIELVEFQQEAVINRSSVDEQTIELLGIGMPKLIIPVRPGRNLGTLVEVAARNELLKKAGIHTALALKQRLEQMILAQGIGKTKNEQ